jgi:hypothetical protein
MSVVMTCDGVMSEGHVVWEWGFEGVLNVVYVPPQLPKGDFSALHHSMSPNANGAPFETRGYAVAHSVISYETAEACRVDAIAALNAALSASMHDGEDLLRELDGGLRYEVRMSFTPAITSALGELLHSPIADLLAAKLGEDAALVSLSAVLSERGADAESAELCRTDEHDVLSVRIALNRTAERFGRAIRSSGATTVWPSCHGGASTAPTGKRLDLDAGDALLLAPHLRASRGAVNGMRRYAVELALSFATSSVALASHWAPGALGRGFSLVPELRGLLSLLSLPVLLDAGLCDPGFGAAPASEAAATLSGPCGSEYLRRSAAGTLAVFSEDGWLFGCHGDTTDLGGSVRSDLAGSLMTSDDL